MQITLIHNAAAGDGDADGDALVRMIEDAGHAVHSVAAEDPDWPAALARPADLVAVSGGDGTIGRVAKRMIGRGIPLAALPSGTANNIALTLGVASRPLREQVEAWSSARTVRVDIGTATGPWGTRRLVEGLGLGLFAASMEVADEECKDEAERQQRVVRALDLLAQRAGALPTIHVRASLDGRDVSGNYLVFEALNTRFVGPNLFLAPNADLGDGLLDVVMVTGDERATLVDHLGAWRRGDMQAPPLRTERGEALQMRWTGFDLHLDDVAWPGKDGYVEQAHEAIEYALGGDSVEFLVP